MQFLRALRHFTSKGHPSSSNKSFTKVASVTHPEKTGLGKGTFSKGGSPEKALMRHISMSLIRTEGLQSSLKWTIQGGWGAMFEGAGCENSHFVFAYGSTDATKAGKSYSSKLFLYSFFFFLG